jgi:two-component system, cell cycle sensor histidine kinase and response regulator CckA
VLPHLAPELLVATVSGRGAYQRTNAAWLKTFGEGALWERLSDEDRRYAEEYVAEAAAGSMVTHQVFLVDQDGRDVPAPILLHFLPVHLPDAPAGRLPVLVTGEVLLQPSSWTEDQTKRRRMEMLGQMAMGIAHDFNNLLTSILGHVELLKARLGPDPTDEHLEPVERAALDGAALVGKIQRYIRQEKRERFDLVDLASVVDEAASLTRPYWHNEPRRMGIEIRLQREVAAVAPIRGSDAELREVFVNLILNAVQAMPDGGTLSLRVYARDERVCAEVEDSGVGMSEGTRSRVFEPLFTTKGESGTGMGLTVCYGIVEEHDGEILVRSQLGRGTCFTLRFPAVRDSPRPKRPKATPVTSGDTVAARILVVDDEPMVRAVTAKLLRLRGHDVTEADSGHSALDIIKEQRVDLVVTDLGMPEMSGRELGYRLRQDHPNLPIILLSGHTDVADQAEHADAVVTKPFKIDHLEATIRGVLAKTR